MGSELGERNRPNRVFFFFFFFLRERTWPNPDSEFGFRVWRKEGSILSWAGSEFGERTWSNTGLEFGFGERYRPNPCSSGSKFGKSNWPNLGSAGSEFGEKTCVRVMVMVSPNSEPAEPGFARSFLRTLKLPFL